MSKTAKRPTLGHTAIPYLDRTMNAATGCNGPAWREGPPAPCDYCYVRRVGRRLACPKCRAGEVHMHPERLAALRPGTRPQVVGVSFMGDLFDPQRPDAEISAVLEACARAPQHAYVFLTKRDGRATSWVHCWMDQPNWWIGATWDGRGDALDAGQILHHLFSWRAMGARTWLSLEPWTGSASPIINAFAGGQPEFVAIGSMSGAGATATDDAERRRWLVRATAIVGLCHGLGVPVWVKQIPAPHPTRPGASRCEHDWTSPDWPPALRVRDLPPGRWGEILAARRDLVERKTVFQEIRDARGRKAEG